MPVQSMDADAARPNKSAPWLEFSGLGAAAGKSIVMIGHSYAQAYISMRSKVALSSADSGFGWLTAPTTLICTRRRLCCHVPGSEPNEVGGSRAPQPVSRLPFVTPVWLGHAPIEAAMMSIPASRRAGGDETG